MDKKYNEKSEWGIFINRLGFMYNLKPKDIEWALGKLAEQEEELTDEFKDRIVDLIEGKNAKRK